MKEIFIIAHGKKKKNEIQNENRLKPWPVSVHTTSYLHNAHT